MRDITTPTEIRDALEAGYDLAVSISGGKDSQAMMNALVRFHRESGFAGRLFAIHSDLGRAEWKSTPETVEAQAAAAGVELVVVRRAKGDLVSRIEDRYEQLRGTGKPFWPSAAQRYCTSDLKRDVIDKELRKFDRVICAVGLRAEESTARSKKPCWETRKRITTKSRQALTWHPILDWTETDVWNELGGRDGENVHEAYGLGNERLSCALCVLASRCDLKNGVRNNRELAERFSEMEKESGFTFTQKTSITELIEEVDAEDAETQEEEPVVVSYGMGVDSTAMLVGMSARGQRPDAILFADTGDEKAQTYAYLETMNTWLRSVGFPEITVVRYQPKRFKYAPYSTLGENCLSNGTLPSLAFGRKSCSLKWKAAPMDKWVASWAPAGQAWERGQKVRRLIGYDAGPKDHKRFCHAEHLAEDERYRYQYPLVEWGWDREECQRQVAAAGLPVPMKSSCVFCPAMKPAELHDLSREDLTKIVAIEHRATPNLKKVEGLWRKATKKRPGRMTTYILEAGLLSAEDVERIQAEAPVGATGPETCWKTWLAQASREQTTEETNEEDALEEARALHPDPTVIHFAGINTAKLAAASEGRPVLISYADVVRRPGVWERELLPRLERRAWTSVILDSGAFTELQVPGFHVDLEAYGAFAVRYRDLFDVVVNLDDIRGDLERTQKNQAYLESLGLRVLPVFHQGEPWSELETMLERYDYVGVGFGRPIKNARTFLDEFFARVDGRTRVHGFGMTRWALAGYDFATTDSTTWIAEFRALRNGSKDHHATNGSLRQMRFQLWTDAELLELALASYGLQEPAGRPITSAKGQARTVLSRFTERQERALTDDLESTWVQWIDADENELTDEEIERELLAVDMLDVRG